MAEYIERRKAAEIVCKIICGSDSGLCVSAPENCQQEKMLEFYKIPTEDVAPVVHGKWLNEDFPEKTATVHDFAICSVCRELSHKAEHGYNILSEYCPHCGARMDADTSTDM